MSFESAQEVWSDPFYVVLPDRVEAGEQRWHATGMIGAVVFGHRSQPPRAGQRVSGPDYQRPKGHGTRKETL
nr:BrnT family toxin [Sphingomonas faeni]